MSTVLIPALSPLNAYAQKKLMSPHHTSKQPFIFLAHLRAATSFKINGIVIRTYVAASRRAKRHPLHVDKFE